MRRRSSAQTILDFRNPSLPLFAICMYHQRSLSGFDDLAQRSRIKSILLLSRGCRQNRTPPYIAAYVAHAILSSQARRTAAFGFIVQLIPAIIIFALPSPPIRHLNSQRWGVTTPRFLPMEAMSRTRTITRVRVRSKRSDAHAVDISGVRLSRPILEAAIAPSKISSFASWSPSLALGDLCLSTGGYPSVVGPRAAAAVFLSVWGAVVSRSARARQLSHKRDARQMATTG